MSADFDDRVQLLPAELPDRLFTIPEVAEYLGVPVSWVEIRVRERKLRCTRIGKHVRFSREHVHEIVADGEQQVLGRRRRAS